VLHEAAILGRIGSHPHVVTLYEQIRLRDGRPALVLEPAAGSLGDLTGAYRPKLPMIVAFGIRVCGALETLHHNGFVHTDIRPATILVTEWGELTVSGFDEAVPIVGAEMHALHQTTPYTAPELLEGGTPTRATDVYGVAVSLYEAAAGHPAFPAYDGEPAAETSLRILRGRHAPLPPNIPLAIVDLLEWAMHVEPKRRPPSPAWFAEELRRFEAGQGWTRTPMVTGSSSF
jgi:serine/threonine protein kinase